MLNSRQCIFSILLIILFIGCNSGEPEKSRQEDAIADDLGEEFIFNEPPEKVISLAPSLTEMIYELGVEETLVGNTTFCNYPPEAKKITKVGDLLTVDYEKILQLEPDLIFISVEGNRKSVYDKFHELGLKVFVSNPRDYAGIKKSFTDLSRIFGMEKRAEKIISEWDSTVSSVKNKAGNGSKETVMFMVDLQPAYIAGSNTFIDELIKFCGLKNIAADSPLNYPVFNREEIIRRDPEYIFYASDTTKKINPLDVYPEWEQLNAIRRNNFFIVDRDLFSRPGPRYVKALKALLEKVHRRDLN